MLSTKIKLTDNVFTEKGNQGRFLLVGVHARYRPELTEIVICEIKDSKAYHIYTGTEVVFNYPQIVYARMFYNITREAFLRKAKFDGLERYIIEARDAAKDEELVLMKGTQHFMGVVGYPTGKFVDGTEVCIGDVVRVEKGKNMSSSFEDVVAIFNNRISVMGIAGTPISVLDITKIVHSHTTLSDGFKVESRFDDFTVKSLLK